MKRKYDAFGIPLSGIIWGLVLLTLMGYSGVISSEMEAIRSENAVDMQKILLDYSESYNTVTTLAGLWFWGGVIAHFSIPYLLEKFKISKV